MKYGIDFNSLRWESPMPGIRHKFLDQQGWRMRLVEYSREMPLHWCEKGHYGYLLKGEMEIEYLALTVHYRPGDGIFIPEGSAHKHRARILSDTARAFFLEKI